MPQHYEKPLDVAAILLDSENPRHDIIQAQRDIIQVMANDHKLAKQLVKLAEDIIEYGNNPSDLPIVMPHETEPGKFVVLEGNRRIAVLKLLDTPSQLPSTSNAIKKRFALLHKEFVKSPIHELKCIVYPDRESADHWIRLKHTGQNEGAGTVNWGGTETSRYLARRQKPSAELTLKSFLYEYCGLTEEEREIIANLPITNIKRVIGDPDMRSALGLSVKGDHIETTIDRDEAARALVDFFMPFALGEKNVGDLYSKENRLDYLANLPKGILPDEKRKVKNPWSLASPPDKSLQSAPKSEGKRPLKRSKPDSTNRPTLIPKNCILTIKDRRINKAYLELRSLYVNDYPNAAAVLFRVFWELSLDHFIEEKNIQEVNSNSSLSKKLDAVSTYLKTKKALSDDLLKPAKKAVSDKHSILSIDTFHSYVHSRHLQPSPQELKLAWDNIQPFMEKLWE